MHTRALFLVPAVLFVGCSVVKHTQTRSDWATTDASKVKRLVVVTSPLPEGKEAVGKLWSRIARRYANQKREFIAKEEVATASLEGGPKSACKEGIEGVLLLVPDVVTKGSGVEAKVSAQLIRCSDGQQDWATEAAGSWAAKDPVLEQTTKEYVEDLGPEVEPYVAPTFHLLKATLDTLPNPVLTSEDQDEKIATD